MAGFIGKGSDFEATNGVRIQFRSSYRGESDYNVWTPGAKDKQTVEYRYLVDEYDPKVWNYSPDEYEREIRGSYQILHTYFGEAVSPEVLEAFREMETASLERAAKLSADLFAQYPDLKADKFTYAAASSTPVYNGFYDHEQKCWVRLLDEGPRPILLSSDDRCFDELWARFGDVPVNDDGKIEEPFLYFKAGTDREEIWSWFEKKFEVSVHDLMYSAEACGMSR